MLRILGSIALACMLAACGTTGGVDAAKTDLATKVGEIRAGVTEAKSEFAEAKEEVIEFAREDVELALAMAEDDNDILASTCYTYVLRVLPELQARDSVETKGIVSKYQKLRGINRRAAAWRSDEFTLACSGLYVDSRRNIGELAGKIAALAARFGIKSFLPIP